ncbi:class II glutamine amidotransferase [Synechococcus elongatus]|uniref:Class II glutamine amidotransferase n=1 Tax=Synechococcus elongatus PCC 11801 TaxID=2219813 RepID=A0AAN1QMR7_SYNEL|nr:class II glutamine amidotransferase [Synechococcus elongatus]AZB72225.1 class II glutamine amidotransferase [Synechococcus elongatus PCC 11801]
MCELLGMSANTPTDLCFSFRGFSARGGRTGEHRDGWGCAFYLGDRLLRVIDPEPAAESPLADVLRRVPIRSKLALSHIRKATQGSVDPRNCHPFSQKLGDREWVFAHNGHIEFELLRDRCPLKYYLPQGETDSEHLFCWILDRLAALVQPEPEQVLAILRDLSDRLPSPSIVNFLLGDGRYLYAHCSTSLAWVTRRYPFTKASLIDEDHTIDFAGCTRPSDVVSIIATRPLTQDEVWTVLNPGDLLVLAEGELVAQTATTPIAIAS